MATTSILGTALDNLRTQLVARAGLSGVRVETGQLGELEEAEVISLSRATVDHEAFAMGGIRRETITITGFIDVARPGQITGTANASAKAARDRALAIVAEIEDQLEDDDTLSGVVKDARFGGYEYTDSATDTGHHAHVEFTIQAEEHLIR
ncbi:MAG: hypothetical protein ACE5EQ_11775 [Phycisphaerae bacterium]